MPLVSIIVPCYNERATIRLLLDGLLSQTYPQAEMEVIIADGRSSDGTPQKVAEFQTEHPELALRIVQNPARTIPAALNCAIAAARGRYIIRLDAHAAPQADYVARCVAALEANLGENVGGVWDIHPGGRGWIPEAIAAATAHPVGVGDARYRYSQQSGEVDTVPFGAFRRDLIDRIGPFDERLLTNEDYEFNTRVRLSGGKVWLDSKIRSVYFARSSLKALISQYWRYGYWKARMLRSYPGTLRWRQALPPLFVASLLILGITSIWVQMARAVLLVEIILYGLALLAAGLQTAWNGKKLGLVFGVPLAIGAMHIAWGAAFLWSLVAYRES